MSVATSFRSLIYQQLEAERPDRRGLSFTNWILLFLILFSLALYTAETERALIAGRNSIFWILNAVVLTAFCFEFVLRLYSVGVDQRYSGWRGLCVYAKSNWIMMIVDFLAFAPELFLLVIGIGSPSWLRMLRVARLLKMVRYVPAFKLVVDAVRSCIQELLVALALASVLWYIASVFLYFAERNAQPEEFGSITRAMWWSVVTLTTVGYGDLYPVTAPGKLIAGLVAVLGIGAVALPGGILAGAFLEKFREKNRTSKDRS